MCGCGAHARFLFWWFNDILTQLRQIHEYTFTHIVPWTQCHHPLITVCRHPLLASIADASHRAFLPPSSRLRSCTSFSAASFPCSSSCATLLEAEAHSAAFLSLIIACGALGAHASNLSAILLVTGSLMCRSESLHCFHTFTAVSLLDPVAKFLQAGEQRGTALREGDGCLQRLPAAALRITDWHFQKDSEPSLLGTATYATGELRQSTHDRQCFDSTHLSIYLWADLPVLHIIQKTKLSRGLPLPESRTKILVRERKFYYKTTTNRGKRWLWNLKNIIFH